MKTRQIWFDWKQNPGSVIEELIPILQSSGIFIFRDPLAEGTDQFGYIFTYKENFTIGDYYTLLDNFQKEICEKVCARHNLKNSDHVDRLSDKNRQEYVY